MEPAPQLPPPPPRPLNSAREVLACIIAQDISDGTVIDPVSVPGAILPWIRATMERRKARHLN
jgi:hypothetical protein